MSKQERSVSRRCIRKRIDATLEKMRWQRIGVRVIYLRPEDREALNKVMSKEFGEGFKLHACGYRDHRVLPSLHKSFVDSEHGVHFTIPKQLSHRVEEAPTP